MAKAEQGAPSIFETDEKLEHAFRGIKLLEGASSKRVPVLRPPDYDREPGCDCPRSELEIGGRGHYSDCDTVTKRVPLDCNGKPLGYVPQPQLGRCWFDKTPHHKNDACFRWYVLREDEQCRGGP